MSTHIAKRYKLVAVSSDLIYPVEMVSEPDALLILEDGSCFRGKSFGAKKTVVGEAVFNTSMTGYQEILTDPSYRGQIVCMTASQIGNYGICKTDDESSGPQVSGFVIRDLSPVTSNWRSHESLPQFLEDAGVPGISGIDTRALVRKLREVGVMKACLSTDGTSEEECLAKAKAWEGLGAHDYVADATTKEKYSLSAEELKAEAFSVPGTDLSKGLPERKRERVYKVAAIDFGAKRSIFKQLVEQGFDVTVYPANTSVDEIVSGNPDAIFLSNGPGDPSKVDYAHRTVATLIEKYPTFGICLGHQIISHAIGAKTYKLKFGHRGGNQPVKNLETERVSITSQNHGYACTPEDLESCGAVVTELNLNDHTVAGLRLKDKPVFSVQYHPEAGPGPNDGKILFDHFYELVDQHYQTAKA